MADERDQRSRTPALRKQMDIEESPRSTQRDRATFIRDLAPESSEESLLQLESYKSLPKLDELPNLDDQVLPADASEQEEEDGQEASTDEKPDDLEERVAGMLRSSAESARPHMSEPPLGKKRR